MIVVLHHGTKTHENQLTNKPDSDDSVFRLTLQTALEINSMHMVKKMIWHMYSRGIFCLSLQGWSRELHLYLQYAAHYCHCLIQKQQVC